MNGDLVRSPTDGASQPVPSIILDGSSQTDQGTLIRPAMGNLLDGVPPDSDHNPAG
jgi:hypothetical protein